MYKKEKVKKNDKPRYKKEKKETGRYRVKN